jgi:hypothetical protein
VNKSDAIEIITKVDLDSLHLDKMPSKVKDRAATGFLLTLEKQN